MVSDRVFPDDLLKKIQTDDRLAGNEMGVRRDDGWIDVYTWDPPAFVRCLPPRVGGVRKGSEDG